MVLLLSLNIGDMSLIDEESLILTLLLIRFDSLLLGEEIIIVLLDMRDKLAVDIALLIVLVFASSIFLRSLSTFCLTTASNVDFLRSLGVLMLDAVILFCFKCFST